MFVNSKQIMQSKLRRAMNVLLYTVYSHKAAHQKGYWPIKAGNYSR